MCKLLYVGDIDGGSGSMAIIVGGAAGGLVVLFSIFIVLYLFCMCVCKKKKSKLLRFLYVCTYVVACTYVSITMS